MANSQNPSQALLKKDGIGIVTLWEGIPLNLSLHTVPTRRMGLGLSHFGKNSIEPFSAHCPNKKEGVEIVTLWEGILLNILCTLSQQEGWG